MTVDSSILDTRSKINRRVYTIVPTGCHIYNTSIFDLHHKRHRSNKVFLGKHSSTLDRNSRFTAPSVYQHELESGAYILQGFERNLLVLPPEAFKTMVRTLTTQNLADPLVRSLLRMVLGTAWPVSLDKNSRLALPVDLKEFAQLEGDVILVGQGDFFEVWQPDLWEEQETILRDAVTNSNRFSTLNITTR